MTKRLAARFGLVGKPNPPGSPLVVIKPTPPPGGGSPGAVPGGGGPGPKPAPKPTPLPKARPVVPTSAHKPLGTPVSNSLIIPPEHQALFGPVLEAIDLVHGDGNLPRIPLSISNTPHEEGSLNIAIKKGFPIRFDSLSLSDKGERPELTLAHEIGHFVEIGGILGPDNRRLQNYRMFNQDPKFEEWKETVASSDAITQLKHIRQLSSTDRDHAKFITYLVSDHDTWARAYAQYIAVRSGDLTLLLQLDRVRSSQGSFVARSQWKDSDFKNIAAALDNLFRKLGWRE